MVRGGYMQAMPGFSRAASKLLVNGRSNRMVNIASIKMMKKIFVLFNNIINHILFYIYIRIIFDKNIQIQM